MELNDFTELLDEKISNLTQERRTLQDNLLNSDWHASSVANTIEKALTQLEKLAETEEVNVAEELLSMLEQIPGVVKQQWTQAIRALEDLDKEIARWKEMGAYYEQFVNNKKEEEERKKSEEASKKEVEKSLEEQIASGEVEEPTRMDQIRRQTGNRPPPGIGRFRKLAAKVNNEETTDADDSRG
tara:strand:+ start:186 stop:740 length:555 start_codon:yes stop_codon:yes gene_type:complete